MSIHNLHFETPTHKVTITFHNMRDLSLEELVEAAEKLKIPPNAKISIQYFEELGTEAVFEWRG